MELLGEVREHLKAQQLAQDRWHQVRIQESISEGQEKHNAFISRITAEPNVSELRFAEHAGAMRLALHESESNQASVREQAVAQVSQLDAQLQARLEEKDQIRASTTYRRASDEHS